MLTCQICIRRYLRALITIHSVPIKRPFSSTTIIVTAAQSFSKGLTTNDIKNTRDRILIPGLGTSGSLRLLGARLLSLQKAKYGSYKRGGISGGVEREFVGGKNGDFSNGRKASRTQSGRNDDIEAYDTTDPRKLLMKIQEIIEMKDFNGAHELVARFSSKIDTVAAWNTLIGCSLKSGSVAKGLKFYNDMKKRGVNPDSFTYHHLLNGLANVPNATTSIMPLAVKIYEQLQGNDKIRPTIVHTNSMLSVCLRVGDMEQAWNILSSLPRGDSRDAPDATTFTIFLRGIRNRAKAVVVAARNEKDGQPDVSEFIQDGRRAWAGALSRWQRGLLRIDEHLINAYLELLQTSPERSAHLEVFNLASQFYGLPPFVLPSKHRPKESSASASSHSDHITPLKSGFRGILYADDYTLGTLLKSAERLRSYELARAAWETLTAPPHNVRTTPITFSLYLRSMSATHSGAGAAKFITSSNHPLTERNYVTALKACVTSGCARSSYANAAAILDHAEEKFLDTVGLMMLRAFLLVALTSCDHTVIKRAILRIKKHIQPSALQHWKSLQTGVPSTEMGEVIEQFLLALKKAVFWDRIQWEQYEREWWTKKVRQTRDVLGSNSFECLDEVEVELQSNTSKNRNIKKGKGNQPSLNHEPDSRKVRLRPQTKPQTEPTKPNSTKERREDKSREPKETVAGLQRFSQAERWKFIDSLK